MSIADINNAASAMNQLKARYEGFLDDADGQIAQRQNAYDGIAANLKGVVNSQMEFTGIIDPDEPNPTNVDGGTFNTISQFVASSPAGCRATMNLENGKNHLLDANIDLAHRHVRVRPRSYTGNLPVMVCPSYASVGYNRLWGFRADGGGMLDVSYVDIEIQGEKQDESLPWASSNGSMILSTVAGHAKLRVAYSSIIGSGGRALTTCNGAQKNDVSLYAVTIAGDMFVVAQADGGVTTLSKGVVSLADGAALFDGGTRGVDFIHNGA